jgi:hypothetical protein
MQRRR